MLRLLTFPFIEVIVAIERSHHERSHKRRIHYFVISRELYSTGEKNSTMGRPLESLKSTISVEKNVPYKITNFSSGQI